MKNLTNSECVLQDPQGNKIVQWRGLQNDDGIVEKEFPLSDQPLLGDWKIVAMLAGVSECVAVSPL